METVAVGIPYKDVACVGDVYPVGVACDVLPANTAQELTIFAENNYVVAFEVTDVEFFAWKFKKLQARYTLVQK